MLGRRRKSNEIRSCWLSSIKPRFLQGTRFSHWDPNLPWWALKTYRNQTLGEFDVDRLCPIFLVPSRGLSCSFVNLNLFSSALVTKRLRIFPKKSYWESHSHQKLRPERREVLIMMRMKRQDHPSQRVEPADSSKNRRSSRYTLAPFPVIRIYWNCTHRQTMV